MVELNTTWRVMANVDTAWQLADLMLELKAGVLKRCLHEDTFVSSVACVFGVDERIALPLGFSKSKSNPLLPNLTNWRLLTPDFLVLSTLRFHLHDLYKSTYVKSGPASETHFRVLQQWLAIHHINQVYSNTQN